MSAAMGINLPDVTGFTRILFHSGIGLPRVALDGDLDGDHEVAPRGTGRTQEGPGLPATIIRTRAHVCVCVTMHTCVLIRTRTHALVYRCGYTCTCTHMHAIDFLHAYPSSYAQVCTHLDMGVRGLGIWFRVSKPCWCLAHGKPGRLTLTALHIYFQAVRKLLELSVAYSGRAEKGYTARPSSFGTIRKMCFGGCAFFLLDSLTVLLRLILNSWPQVTLLS